MRRKIWNLVCILGFTALACGIYLFVGNDINKSWAIADEGSGSKTTTTTSGCGSYLSYPPRCSEGYDTKSVKYGTRTCYTKCTKKYYVVKRTCSSGSAYTSAAAAETACKRDGYTKAIHVDTLENGMVCMVCSGWTMTCESEGLYSTQKQAATECGGTDFVASTRDIVVNGKVTTCYGCKGNPDIIPEPKCKPTTVVNCDEKSSCESVGGTWNAATGKCAQKYATYNEFCSSKGLYYQKQVCPEWYESNPVGGGSWNYGYTCYTKCQLESGYRGEMICRTNNLSHTEPVCENGVKAESKIIAGFEEVAKCYYPCGKTNPESGYTMKIDKAGEYEQYATYTITFEKEGWSVFYQLLGTNIIPSADSTSMWINTGSDRSATLIVEEAGLYSLWARDPNGESVELIENLVVSNPANNTIKNLGVDSSSAGVTGNNYYGESMDTESATDELDDYTVVAPQSTKITTGGFQMLSTNKKAYDVKLLGDSKTDKTLTVDPDTGLLLYTLSDAEKLALGITTEKVYVVASKPEAKLSRNEDGTFTKNENGDVIAASKNELGTIYKITPKNDISTMSEYIFYAINLSYIENADYSDPNTWNDLKLLSYNTTTTADTDFTFEIVRNGMTDIVKQLSSTKESYKIVPLASSTAEDLGTFYIDFESDVTQYEFSIDDDEITLNPILVYTNSEYVEGFGPRTVDLEYGLNVEFIKVESAKGTIRTYTLLITRTDSRSSDNTLKSLVARNVSLTPTFTKYTNEYYGTVVNSTTKVEIAAEKNSNDATFVEGYGSRTVDLKVGENTILVKVKSETEAERTYKIVITREGTPEVVVVDKTKSANNNLKSLNISSGNLMFDTNVLNYNLYVSNDITSVLTTAVAEDETAKVVVTGGANLLMGANTVEVIVTAENGTTKTYTINIIKKEEGLAVSSDSTLSTLQIRGERLNFSPINYLYTVVVFPGTEELVFNLEASNNKAQIEVIGNMELTDFTTIKVKVIAEDGSYSIYDVNVKVDNITTGEIIAFAVCTALVVGLVVYGTISRNKKQKLLKAEQKDLIQ